MVLLVEKVVTSEKDKVVVGILNVGEITDVSVVVVALITSELFFIDDALSETNSKVVCNEN